jgi:hypothetical protein
MAGSITVFQGVVVSHNGSPGLLFPDNTALLNFDRLGSLDTLLAANRIVFTTPEVEFEAVQKAIATNDPAKIASANRISEWIRVHEASGEVQSSTTLNPTRPLFTEQDPISKQGIGEQSILAEIAYLKQTGSNTVDPIVVSDVGHVALKYFPGSDEIPVLTGNYFLSGLLLGGRITPNDYYRLTTDGAGTGFSQQLFSQDQSSRLEKGNVYPIIGGETGTFMYTTVGSSLIVIDGKAVIEFAPYEKAGVQDGKWIKVTDASDGGHTDTYFDTANLQPWFTNALAYDPQDRLSGNDTLNDDGTSTKTVFDTGTESWSSQTSAFDAYQRLQSQRVVLDSGGQQVKQYDPNNTHPYDEVDIDEDATGKPTNVQTKFGGQSNAADFSAARLGAWPGAGAQQPVRAARGRHGHRRRRPEVGAGVFRVAGDRRQQVRPRQRLRPVQRHHRRRRREFGRLVPGC